MARILVVDDSLIDRMVIKRILIQNNHDVIELENADKILEKIQTCSPDLILLDVIMPGNNGFEICRIVKNSQIASDIPVIFLSSKKQKSDIFWGKFQGAEDYLTKPCPPHQLLSTIDRWLDYKRDVRING